MTATTHPIRWSCSRCGDSDRPLRRYRGNRHLELALWAAGLLSTLLGALYLPLALLLTLPLCYTGWRYLGGSLTVCTGCGGVDTMTRGDGAAT